jgi:hypothetical protein
MVKDQDFVAIFHSIHRVLKAEKILKKAEADFLLIPVPRQLTSDCGLALRFSPEEKPHILAMLELDNLSPVEVHQRQGEGYVAVKGRKP